MKTNMLLVTENFCTTVLVLTIYASKSFSIIFAFIGNIFSHKKISEYTLSNIPNACPSSSLAHNCQTVCQFDSSERKKRRQLHFDMHIYILSYLHIHPYTYSTKRRTTCERQSHIDDLLTAWHANKQSKAATDNSSLLAI